MSGAMRIDLFLWYARLAKTRAAAQALACEGRVRIGGRVIDRAAAPVRAGDVLTFAHHGRIRVLRIEALPPRRGPAPEAQACYQELSVDARLNAAAGENANVSHEAQER